MRVVKICDATLLIETLMRHGPLERDDTCALCVEEDRDTAPTLRRRSRSNSSTLHFPLRRSRSSSLGSVISDVADDHFVDAPVVVTEALQM